MKRGIILSLLTIGIVGYGLAQEHPEHPKKAPAQPAPGSAKAEAGEAVVTGKNFCLGCSLKKEWGAAAQCSKYGHRHALKVTTATADGKEVPDMKGWVLHYLDTDNAQPYIKEHHEETLTLQGKVYSGARVLEVGQQEAAKKPDHPEHPDKP
jgi:hypothetical protein